MKLTISPVIGIPFAIIFALIAIIIWYALVRPVPEQISKGIVHGAVLADEQTIERTVPRNYRNLEYVSMTSKIKIPERYIYDIEIVEAGETIKFSNMSPDLDYAIGSEVTVRYVERSLPLIWKKRFINAVVSENAAD